MCGELEDTCLPPLGGPIKPNSVGLLEEWGLKLKTPTCKIYNQGQSFKQVVLTGTVPTISLVRTAPTQRVAPPNVQLRSSRPAAGAPPPRPIGPSSRPIGPAPTRNKLWLAVRVSWLVPACRLLLLSRFKTFWTIFSEFTTWKIEINISQTIFKRGWYNLRLVMVTLLLLGK